MSRGRGRESTPIVLILIRPFVSMALCVLIIAPYPPPPLCSNIQIYLPAHQVESFSNKNLRRWLPCCLLTLKTYCLPCLILKTYDLLLLLRNVHVCDRGHMHTYPCPKSIDYIVILDCLCMHVPTIPNFR